MESMLVVRGHHHDHRHVLPMLELAHHFQPAHGRHLQIEKNQIGMLAADLYQCRGAIFRLPHDLDAADGFQSLAQNLTGDRLVVDDQRLQSHAGSPATTFSGSRKPTVVTPSSTSARKLDSSP